MKRWQTKPLGEVAEFVRGITFKPADLVEAGTADSLACFRTKNVQAALEADDLIHIPRSFVKTDRQLVREGDALISTANSNNLVGKCCFVPHLDYPATLGGFIAAVRPNPKTIQPRFLYYWLASPPEQKRLRTLARQTTNISNLPLTDVAKEPAPVPPLAEQERIVKLLDEVDELRKLRTQADRRTVALIPALFHEMFGDSATNERKWPVIQLSEIITRITNGYVGPTRDIYQESGVPYILARHIENNQVYFDGKTYISTQFNTRNKKSILRAGDVVLVQSGVNTGEAAVVPPEHYGHNCHALIVMSPVQERLMGEYLCYWLSAGSGRRLTTEIQTGATIPHLNCGHVKLLRIMLPPLPLQKEFAQRATEIRELEASQATSRTRLDALFQSMLHRAFNGEL